jgi:hypothetical protein
MHLAKIHTEEAVAAHHGDMSFLSRRPEVSVAPGLMFRGWGSEVDGHEYATLNQHRETTAGESGADEIEQGSPGLVRR